MIVKLFSRNHFCAILIMGLVLVATSGCHTLRKKFVRKKKTQEQPPVYVDFKDYSEVGSKRIYQDYYYFTSGWLSELLSGFQDHFNYKGQSRAIDEVIKNLGKINDMLSGSGKQELAPLLKQAKRIQEKLAPNLTNLEKRFLSREIEMLKIRFDKKFDYGSVAKWLN